MLSFRRDSSVLEDWGEWWDFGFFFFDFEILD